MKKLIALLLAVLMLTALAACDTQNPTDTTGTNPTSNNDPSKPEEAFRFTYWPGSPSFTARITPKTAPS